MGSLERWWICRNCLRPYERSRADGAPPQRCPCRRIRDEPTWPRFDFNERLHLCDCCHRVALTSGSKYSMFFCEPCKKRVVSFNDRLRFWLIPIGRHSFMARRYEGSPNFLAIPATVAVSADRGDPSAEADLEVLVGEIVSLFDRIGAVGSWSRQHLGWYLDELGLRDGSDPTIARLFAALTEAAKADERFGADRAFTDLTEHMARNAGIRVVRPLYGMGARSEPPRP
jgi:hypothetical protein